MILATGPDASSCAFAFMLASYNHNDADMQLKSINNPSAARRNKEAGDRYLGRAARAATSFTSIDIGIPRLIRSVFVRFGVRGQPNQAMWTATTHPPLLFGLKLPARPDLGPLLGSVTTTTSGDVRKGRPDHRITADDGRELILIPVLCPAWADGQHNI